MQGEVIDLCGSTNDFARELAFKGAPHGSWISARRQDRGRGRLGREWVSMEGNLFLSMIFRVPRGASVPITWIPLVTALGVARALDKWALVSIKWPNDLWIGDAKLGGILCESFGSLEGTVIVAGVGINGPTAPENVGQEACALGEMADTFRLPVIEGIQAAWSRLLTEGAAWVAPEYERRATFTRGSTVGTSEFSGEVEGLGSFGELRVKLKSGEIKSVFAEDVQKIRLKRT